MADLKHLDYVIERVGDLPALPDVVTEVLRITDDPLSSTSDVCDCLQEDPALTAKVLRVSNSSYYGMKQYVGTLKLALVILGVKEVRNVVIGISVFDTLNDKPEGLKLAQDIWNSSLRVAGLSRFLANYMGVGLQGQEFVAGLLTDIGKMCFLRQFHTPYAPMFLELKDNLETLCQEEYKEFGCNHADVAMALAMRWHLPQAIADALWYQFPDRKKYIGDAKDPKLAALVRIAKLALYDNFKKSEGLLSVEDSEPWDILANVKTPVEVEQRRDLLISMVEELNNAPVLPL